MAYANDISTNGKLDSNKVLIKMTAIKAAHCENSASRIATNIAFDYGRNLIGFDKAEAWRTNSI